MTEAIPEVDAPVIPADKPGLKVTTETLDIPVFTEQKEDKAADAKGVQKKAGEAPAPGEKPETTDEQPEKPGKNRFERRLDKAYRRAAEEKARADLLERQLADFKPKEQPKAGSPRLEDFTDIEEYAKARAKQESDDAIKKYEATQQEQTFKRATEQLSASWEERSAKAAEKYDDFDVVVGELAPVNPVSIAIMQAENGEDIAYYLGTHLKEAARIAQLDPLSQAREIGRLEAKFLAEPPTPKAPSKAPAPIAPLSGASVGTKDIWSNDTDMKTFMKARQKQVHGR